LADFQISDSEEEEGGEKLEEGEETSSSSTKIRSKFQKKGREWFV
jgi:hypothetical protein